MFEGKVFSQICKALRKEENPLIYEKGKHELFSNWFVSNIEFASVDVYQGRHPDVVITENNHIEGYELKSAKSRNADVQYNSTPPCGTMLYQGIEVKCFYVFADYNLDSTQTQGFGEDLIIVDGDYINSDFGLVEQHSTSYEPCGSYGDGRIRHRKMYHFPNPLKFFEHGYYLVSKDEQLNRQFADLIKQTSTFRIDQQGVKNIFSVYTYRS